MALKTLDDLRKSGYKYESASKCKKCGADIEWWKTPSQKLCPFDFGTATSHFATCPDAEHFREKGAARDYDRQSLFD